MHTWLNTDRKHQTRYTYVQNGMADSLPHCAAGLPAQAAIPPTGVAMPPKGVAMPPTAIFT